MRKCLLDKNYFEKILQSSPKKNKDLNKKEPEDKVHQKEEAVDYSNLFSGEWKVMRKNLYWKWDWEEDYWVMRSEKGNFSIHDVDKSEICTGKLNGLEFNGKWSSSVGEFVTTIRFDRAGKHFEGKRCFGITPGEKVKNC